MNFSMDGELCVLPSGVTAIRQAMGQVHCFTANILVWDGQAGRDMEVLLGERMTECVGVCGQGTGRCITI